MDVTQGSPLRCRSSRPVLSAVKKCIARMSSDGGDDHHQMDDVSPASNIHPEHSADSMNAAVIMECVQQQLAHIEVLNAIQSTLDESRKRASDMSKENRVLVSSLDTRLVCDDVPAPDIAAQLKLQLSSSIFASALSDPPSTSSQSPVARIDQLQHLVATSLPTTPTSELGSAVRGLIDGAVSSLQLLLSRLHDLATPGRAASLGGSPEVGALIDVCGTLIEFAVTQMRNATAAAGPPEHLEAVQDEVGQLEKLLADANARVVHFLGERNVADADTAVRQQLDLQTDLHAAIERKVELLGRAVATAPDDGSTTVAVGATRRRVDDTVSTVRARLQRQRGGVDADIASVDAFLTDAAAAAAGRGLGGGAVASLAAVGLKADLAAQHQADAAAFAEFLDGSESEEARLWNVLQDTVGQLRGLVKERCSCVKQRVVKILDSLNAQAEMRAAVEAARNHRSELQRLATRLDSQSRAVEVAEELSRTSGDVIVRVAAAVRDAGTSALHRAQEDLVGVYEQWHASRVEFVRRKRQLVSRLERRVRDLDADVKAAVETLDPDADALSESAEAAAAKLSAVKGDADAVESDLAAMQTRMESVLREMGREAQQLRSTTAKGRGSYGTQRGGAGQEEEKVERGYGGGGIKRREAARSGTASTRPPPRGGSVNREDGYSGGGRAASRTGEGATLSSSVWADSAGGEREGSRYVEASSVIGGGAGARGGGSVRHSPPMVGGRHCAADTACSRRPASRSGSASRGPSAPPMPDIFGRLTDTKGYTGVHRRRFDAEGRGRSSQRRGVFGDQ